MTTYVLVSGAWHAGWCWERVVPELEAASHTALAPDLLGMGPDPTPAAGVTLAAWADQVADVVRGAGEPVVLVGHSRGGIVISEAAERAPDRVARLVYLAAFLLPTGGTLLAASARAARGDLGEVLDMRDDGTSVVRPDAVAPLFYNTTAPEWVEHARARLTPEPMAAFATPLQLTDAGFGSVPRAYIECLQDRAVPLELQRLMQGELPCDPVFTMDTDHSPFFSAPAELARLLLRLA